MVLPDYDFGPAQVRELEIPELSPQFKEILGQLPLPPLVRKQPPPCGLVEIAGNMAVGKTKAGETLQEVLDGTSITFHPERWWENPHLKDPSQRSQSERWFLEAKRKDNRKVFSYPRETVVFQDVPCEGDHFFTIVDFVLGVISPEQFFEYQEHYNELVVQMVRPDLVIFLQCGIPEIFRRIGQRGREFEQSQGLRIVALEYLTKRWLKEGGWDVPVLTINSERLDFDDDHQGKRELARQVVEKLQELDGEKFWGLGVREK